MKILITNTVALNGGDAAILLSIINLFKLEFGQDVKFVVYDSQPEIAYQYYPNLKFRKLIYSRLRDTPPMKFLGRSFAGRAVRRLLGNSLRFFSQINPPRFYCAAWCHHHQRFWLTKLLVSSDELQDIEHYSSADLIVSTGGTYLVESYSPLTSRIFDYQLTLLMKKPLVFFTQSLGPFVTKYHQRVFQNIFNQSLLILLRDEASLRHLQKIQVDTKHAFVSSDVVFSFSDGYPSKNFASRALGISPLQIAISVRNWKHFQTTTASAGMEQFKGSIAALTQHLIEKYKAEITFISTCQGITEYWTDDSKVAFEIVESLPPDIQDRVKVNREFHTPQELIRILRNIDLVIATRMHMAILSLVAGTPVFPIAYEFKTKELFSRLQMGEWVHDIEAVRAESLISSLESFFQSKAHINQILSTHVEIERQRALESGKLVRTALENLSSSSR